MTSHLSTSHDLSLPAQPTRNGGLWQSLREGNTRFEEFSGFVGYLAGLRNEGALDDQTFSGLMKYAAALFVESEASICIYQVLDQGLMAITSQEQRR